MNTYCSYDSTRFVDTDRTLTWVNLSNG